jgi:hypothetical protein
MNKNMIRLSTNLLACIVAVHGLSVSPALGAPVSLTAATPYMTLRITVEKNYAGVPMLREDFSTNDPVHHNVLCASGFLDVKYQLKDSAGRMLAPDPQPWKRDSDMLQGGGGYVAGAPDPCKISRVDLVHRGILLTDYYPKLQHGRYTLYVTLAPRGSSYHTAFSPISIVY